MKEGSESVADADRVQRDRERPITCEEVVLGKREKRKGKAGPRLWFPLALLLSWILKERSDLLKGSISQIVRLSLHLLRGQSFSMRNSTSQITQSFH